MICWLSDNLQPYLIGNQCRDRVGRLERFLSVHRVQTNPLCVGDVVVDTRISNGTSLLNVGVKGDGS